MCYSQREIIYFVTYPNQFGPDQQSRFEAHCEECLTCGKAAQETAAVVTGTLTQKNTDYHTSKFI